MRRLLLFAVIGAFPLVSRGGMQSALDPKGAHAGQIAELSHVLFLGGGLIFVLVLALAAVALFGPASWRRALGGRALIIGGGIAFPVIVLSALLVYALLSSAALVRADAPPAVRIAVTGEIWWWRVRYLDSAGAVLFETANDIRIPAGQPVDLQLTTADVIHSFWVPNLAGKIDMIPGHINTQRLHAEAPGVFRGQCAEYCGAQHANMAFHVIALAPQEFDAWAARQAAVSQVPADPLALRGSEVFQVSKCGKCHTVRGTAATGSTGPDLTHVGSRWSLGAGMLPNNVGAFGGWIAGSQHVKPGNLMRPVATLGSEDLRAVAAYMESLQ